MACNLKDQAPIHSLWPAGITPQERAQADTTLQAAEAQLRNGQPGEALKSLQTLPMSVHDTARWQFRYAQALEAEGAMPESLASYSLARDLDGCRFRAPQEFGELVRTLAAQWSEPSV